MLATMLSMDMLGGIVKSFIVNRTRGALRGALLIAGMTMGPAALAAYPERPIRWVVSAAAAGGAADVTVRIVEADLAKRLNQQIVIDNCPGASKMPPARIRDQ